MTYTSIDKPDETPRAYATDARGNQYLMNAQVIVKAPRGQDPYLFLEQLENVIPPEKREIHVWVGNKRTSLIYQNQLRFSFGSYRVEVCDEKKKKLTAETFAALIAKHGRKLGIRSFSGLVELIAWKFM